MVRIPYFEYRNGVPKIINIETDENTIEEMRECEMFGQSLTRIKFKFICLDGSGYYYQEFIAAGSLDLIKQLISVGIN